MTYEPNTQKIFIDSSRSGLNVEFESQGVKRILLTISKYMTFFRA